MPRMLRPKVEVLPESSLVPAPPPKPQPEVEREVAAAKQIRRGAKQKGAPSSEPPPMVPRRRGRG